MSDTAVAVKPARRLRAQFRPRAATSAAPAALTQATPPPFDEVKLNEAVRASLPPNYNFELPKTLTRIHQVHARRIALQLPEGLLAYSCIISDIIEEFAHGAETFIMGDVTYGACCVDDLTAKTFGCDMLVHYGHSCLIPIDITAQALPTSDNDSTFTVMYVFVDIAIDSEHLIDTIQHNFPVNGGGGGGSDGSGGGGNGRKLMLASTIQFAASLQFVAPALTEMYGAGNIVIPQAKPLSKGEVLGCTAPIIDTDTDTGVDTVIFVADGRFHLESLMIQNPSLTFYQYNPYDRRLTLERYHHSEMLALRQSAIETVRHCRHWALILGTLGRQGNPALLQRLIDLLTAKGVRHTVFLLSEITYHKLLVLSQGEGGIDCAVQIACPRLSIDWGHQFPIPLLNTYEADVVLNLIEFQPVYPMDYYADRGGDWSNYAERRKKKEADKLKRQARKTVAIQYEHENQPAVATMSNDDAVAVQ